MNILFLDLGMGAAGDMLTAALYELLDDADRKTFLDKVNALGLEGVCVKAVSDKKCGITGTHMEVTVNGVEEGSDDHHHGGHDHDHQHHELHHEHHSGSDIESAIAKLNVSDKVKQSAIAIYDIIAKAESSVHGVPVSDIHFHEVGTKDAITDVTSVCILMEMLRPDRIVATPVCTGFGKVKCAHGILPVPAPATATILEGVPSYAGNIEGELCTPTGAAIIKYFVNEYSSMPVMTVEKIGYGLGKKDFEAANVVRAMLGAAGTANASITELACNIDDMTGEAIGYAVTKLLEEGALDVFTTPVMMKKSRPAVMLTVLCNTSDTEKMVRTVFKHTSTLGIRKYEPERYTLERSTELVETPFGKVHVKKVQGYGISRSKFEYDDIRSIAEDTGMSIDEVARGIDGK